mmetsp:Transcript_22325/g.56116  ORF Transcript_22325/g.56116 Transcript_22325/m.56116 type:complete len:420 (+) Transcript_22325:4607-5866(+)
MQTCVPGEEMRTYLLFPVCSVASRNNGSMQRSESHPVSGRENQYLSRERRDVALRLSRRPWAESCFSADINPVSVVIAALLTSPYALVSLQNSGCRVGMPHSKTASPRLPCWLRSNSCSARVPAACRGAMHDSISVDCPATITGRISQWESSDCIKRPPPCWDRRAQKCESQLASVKRQAGPSKGSISSLKGSRSSALIWATPIAAASAFGKTSSEEVPPMARPTNSVQKSSGRSLRRGLLRTVKYTGCAEKVVRSPDSSMSSGTPSRSARTSPPLPVLLAVIFDTTNCRSSAALCLRLFRGASASCTGQLCLTTAVFRNATSLEGVMGVRTLANCFCTEERQRTRSMPSSTRKSLASSVKPETSRVSAGAFVHLRMCAPETTGNAATDLSTSDRTAASTTVRQICSESPSFPSTVRTS